MKAYIIMDDILKKLDIDETFEKRPKKDKYFTHVRDNIPDHEFYNYQADLLELPKTKEGYKYLLLVVDLATGKFDIEPIKNKGAETTLNALKKYLRMVF